MGLNLKYGEGIWGTGSHPEPITCERHFFKTREAPYPVERTLLVSGVLDAAMHSHQDGGRVVSTPELEFSYAAKDFRAFRETGESWRVITPEMPEPTKFEPGTG